MPSLRAKIEAVEAETHQIFGEHNERMVDFVTRIGQVDKRPQPGDPAPDFSMPSAEGTLVTLSEIIGRRGLVLIFIRGLWCPYCNAQMTSYEERADDFAAAGLEVAFITPEIGGRAAETKRTLGLSGHVVCDVDEGVALSYGCLFPVPHEDRQFLTEVGFDLGRLYGVEAWFMPLASTFLIDRQQRIAAVFGSADQRERTDPEAVLQAAQLLDAGA